VSARKSERVSECVSDTEVEPSPVAASARVKEHASRESKGGTKIECAHIGTQLRGGILVKAREISRFHSCDMTHPYV